MRILYVEDNPANLSLVERVARIGKHDVVTYMNGTSALENFERDQPDLVLMDVQLPGSLTGLDVVRKLRADGHKVPIIAVTAYAMVGDRERCLAAGCDDYIAKPLPIADLVTLFERYATQVTPPTIAAPKATDTAEAQMAAGKISALFIPKSPDSDRLSTASPTMNVPLPKTEHPVAPVEPTPPSTDSDVPSQTETKSEKNSATPQEVAPSSTEEKPNESGRS